MLFERKNNINQSVSEITYNCNSCLPESSTQALLAVLAGNGVTRITEIKNGEVLFDGKKNPQTQE